MDQDADFTLPPTPNSATQVAPKPHNPKLSFRPSISIILLLVVLLLTLAALVINYQLTTTAQHMLIQTQTVQQQQGNELGHLHQSVKRAITAQSQLATQMTQTEQHIQMVLKEQHYQSNDWQLQKAHYYLELAQINAYWTDNKPTTVALLNQADLVLAHIQNAKLESIHQAIAQDLVTLQKLPILDTQALLARLQTLQQDISLLNKPTSQLKNSAQASITSNQPTTWRDRLLDTLQQLHSLVVVHHYDDNNVIAQLTPTYIAMRRESIRLNLQEAQIATLNHQQTLYTLALDTALNNIKHSFNINEPQTIAVIQTLQSLKTLSLERQQPIEINALRLLETVTQEAQPVTVTKPSERQS